MLQTRSGKRTAKAAIKIAVDMVNEKLISKKEASKKGIEHLVITEEDFQKYIQAPSDDYEARGKFYTLEEEN